MNNNTKNYYRIEPENYREGKSDIIIQPKMQPEMTLVFLHGMGDSPLGYVDFFISEHSPLPVNSKIILLCAPEIEISCFNRYKCRNWFDVINRNLKKEIDYAWLKKNDNCKKISEILKEECNLYYGDYTQIILGGFGEGGCMALWYGLTINSKFGGLFSLSGVVLHQITEDIITDKKQLKIFIGYGAKDTVIPLDIAEHLNRNIKSICQYKIYQNMGHAISKEEL